MYAEDYDYDYPPPSRYSSRDYFYDEPPLRERDRDRLPFRGSSALDDPYYSRPREPLLSAPGRRKHSLMSSKYPDDMEDTAGGYVQGSVIMLPPPPFESKPKVSSKPANCNTVFVGSIPDNTNDNNLYDLFSKCGSIKDIRIATERHFAHVEFANSSSVDSAVELNGYIIRVGPTHSPADKSKIQVDFAQSRERSIVKRRANSGEGLGYTPSNATAINSELRSEEGFELAANNLVSWLEKGSCNPNNAATFFSMLSTTNLMTHRVKKDVNHMDDELQEFMTKRDKKFGDHVNQCDVIDSVFSTAMQKRSWDNFSKPQRKSITQWKDMVQEVKDSIKKKQQDTATNTSTVSSEERPSSAAKKPRLEEASNAEADLDRAEREIEQLRVDHEVALEKSERQILQLKTLLAKFKQSCPKEWQKIVVGVESKPGDKAGAKSVKTDEESDPEGEVIDGVNLSDLNNTLEGGGSDKSLAAAAAAYAEVRSQMATSSDEAGVSEKEVALAAVMTAFLTVHPLGASMSEISTYFQTFNPTYNSYYLESLLRRMPKVFQLSQAANGEPRWWFLGFQTISVTVSAKDSKPLSTK